MINQSKFLHLLQEDEEEENECSICCVELKTRGGQKKVNCLHCNYIACQSCLQRVILNSLRAKCPNCEVAWNDEFIQSNLTKTFFNKEYKTHITNIILVNEKNKLIDEQENAKNHKENEKLIRDLNENLKKLDDELLSIMYEKENKKKLKKIRTQIKETKDTLKVAKWNNSNILSGGNKIKTDRREFVRKCPVEDCRGFLSSAWKCKMCDVWTCKDCGEVKEEQKDDEHKCDPNNIETMKSISKETVPCPKCGMAIFKSGGCSQMWSTCCNVAFDWRTGKIDTGKVHNPHYFEWKRTQTDTIDDRIPLVNPGNGPCEDAYEFYRYIDKTFESFQQTVAHFQYLTNNLTDRINKDQNFDLRIRFLINEIDEKQWIRMLKSRNTRTTNLANVRDIYDMFVTAAKDTIMAVNNDMFNKKTIDKSAYLKEMYALVDYTNNSLKKFPQNITYITKKDKFGYVTTKMDDNEGLINSDFNIKEKIKNNEFTFEMIKKYKINMEYSDWDLVLDKILEDSSNINYFKTFKHIRIRFVYKVFLIYIIDIVEIDQTYFKEIILICSKNKSHLNQILYYLDQKLLKSIFTKEIIEKTKYISVPYLIKLDCSEQFIINYYKLYGMRKQDLHPIHNNPIYINKPNFSIEFYKFFSSYIEWSSICLDYFSDEFIETFIDKFKLLNSFSYNNTKRIEEIVLKFYKQIPYLVCYFVCRMKFNETTIRKLEPYLNNNCWMSISKTYIVSDQFLLDFKTKIYWNEYILGGRYKRICSEDTLIKCMNHLPASDTILGFLYKKDYVNLVRALISNQAKLSFYLFWQNHFIDTLLQRNDTETMKVVLSKVRTKKIIPEREKRSFRGIIEEEMKEIFDNHKKKVRKNRINK